MLGSITASVDKELRLRNAYLVAENRILRQQISGRVHLTDSDRKALAELGQQLGKKALEEMATVAKPDTILAWHRTFAAQQADRAQLHKSVGRPRIEKIEDLCPETQGTVKVMRMPLVRAHAIRAGPLRRRLPLSELRQDARAHAA